MNDLMKVTYKTGQPTVSARELHDIVGCGAGEVRKGATF